MSPLFSLSPERGDKEPSPVSFQTIDTDVYPLSRTTLIFRGALEYLSKLDRSFEQLRNGEVIVKSLDELESMADE